MKRFDANSWEGYELKEYQKRTKREKEAKSATKKEKMMLKKRKSLNRKIIAKLYSDQMKKRPSALEVKMQNFLDTYKIVYDFQKIFYIKDKFNNIMRFYIVDFYIPSKNLIIETDGSFHKDQVEEDNMRTYNIQKHYPNVKVVRWQWKDFYSYGKMKELAKMVV